MEPRSARSETALQLEQLRVRLQSDTPLIYRHWALYLQVLRDGLPAAVEKACFRLAVDELPLRYRAMPADARSQLHRRLAALVKRSLAFLTVEQLQATAQQRNRRAQRAALRQQRRLLAAMQQPQAQGLFEQSPLFGQPTADPPGSVRLGLRLPLGADLGGSLGGSLGDALSGAFRGSQGVEHRDPQSDQLADDSSGLTSVVLGLLEASQFSQGDHPDAGLETLLPTEPLPLLRWFDQLDAAVARRLRQLSHAINVELVRQGLCTTLLPLHLLEAVAEGQLETEDAPLHLVRLNLAATALPVSGLPEALGVLLRPADLEVEALRLRTCRSRLQQARQEVRRMAQTYHRLERRLQALEAEQLWLHDHSTARQIDPQAET